MDEISSANSDAGKDDRPKPVVSRVVITGEHLAVLADMYEEAEVLYDGHQTSPG